MGTEECVLFFGDCADLGDGTGINMSAHCLPTHDCYDAIQCYSRPNITIYYLLNHCVYGEWTRVSEVGEENVNSYSGVCD